MERLTDCAQGYCEMYCKKYTFCFEDPENCAFKDEIKLYEALKSIEGIVPLDRLLELACADKAGQLVVLPCKVGDTVYVIDKGDYTHAFKPYVRSKTVREISWKATSRKDLGWGLILAGGDCGTSARYKLSSIGKTVFLSREEADAALAGKGGEG